MTLNRLWGTDLDISDQDLLLTIDRFGERYIEPAVERIANFVDAEGLALFKQGFNMVGVPGTDPTSLATYVAAGVTLHNMAAPSGMRSSVVSPAMEGSILGFQSNLFNPSKTISEQYMTGKMGMAVGQKFSMDQNIQRFTTGTVSGTPVVSGANQSGTSLITTGWGSGVTSLKQGDIISVVGMNGVNPISYGSFGKRRTFTVTQDISDTTGGITIPISPAIDADTTSPFQTVDSLPVNGNAVYFWEQPAANFANVSNVSSAQGLTFHQDAFTLALAKLELPGGMDWSEQVSNPKIGFSIRLIRGFDIRTNRRYTRLDLLGGWAMLRGELNCRVAAG